MSAWIAVEAWCIQAGARQSIAEGCWEHRALGGALLRIGVASMRVRFKLLGRL